MAADLARLLEVLDAVSADLTARTALLGDHCSSLKASLCYCSSSWQLKKRVQEQAEAAKNEEDQLRLAVAHAESALEEALKRAKSIRGATVKRVPLKVASESAPSSMTTGAEAAAAATPLALPRKMTSQIKEVQDMALLWRGRDAPPTVAAGKLNQILAQRDSVSSAVPIRISYRDQLERIQKAYACVLHVLETKCSSYPADAAPSLPTVFPTWFRLNKVKHLLQALNAELAACLQRIPPPPVLSKRAATRSQTFLQAITCDPQHSVDNAPLHCENDASSAIYTKLQAAWNADMAPLVEAPAYVGAIDNIASAHVCKYLVPPLQERLHATASVENASYELDSMALLRLLHSLTCCDGLDIRSVILLDS
ncbi:hypothetical protein SPRG_16024 [Saprolegnia parasitica CBS 223.65]|uniref:Uncharacterized protein n=1 Tax=Saprolegnia parasitica (strain CBS 223.65) TaxID=695850 RepID=A0A067BVS0_SAPPC|nr:hypothetical protein SPRG_16024 [Saprolegnia parasitica CBS 223.65]KDO18667.1 hypothetical protein SPRG_16024 [Saprolegnia parasitica CBS 223.65]|eukprot:XP_012210631.1 hypothetical protein SPRG_16024 [Saprolegnia parasitica CBS 223.65]